MSKPIISATEFKAKCLSFLAAVEQQGDTITITRRGKPVATLGPAKKISWKSPANSWASRAEILGDIVSAETAGFWEVVSPEETSR